MEPGASASATISVAPLNNFSGTISFACSVTGPLVNVTCSVPSTTVNTSGSTTVTVTAPNAAVKPVRLFRNVPPLNPWWPLLGLALPMASYAFRKRRLAYARGVYVWGAAGFLFLTLGAVSCGSGSGSGSDTVALACTLPQNAQVGVGYIGSCTTSGGKGPFTYTITSGTLPSGLSINSSSGAITGTPTMTQGSSFTVEVTDSNSNTASEAILLSVAAPAPQSGHVIVTATSGAIVNTVSIAVTVL
jgi:hypothetical protein